MAAAASIDLHADDKGLAACFRLANVQKSWMRDFVTHHRVETLEEIIFFVEKATWEPSLMTLVDEVQSIRESRLILARFKSAWQSGVTAIQAAQTATAKHESADVEEPIPELQFQQLANDWQGSYNLKIEPHLDPSDSLRARVWREFKRRALTIMEMSKVKSVVGGASPLDEDKISFEKGVTIQFNKTDSQAPKSVVEYYLKLRILCYAWSWSGNFEAKCLDGKEYIMMTLTCALEDADFVLRHTLLYGQQNLAWMSKLDLLTRGTMAGKVRRGMIAEHALLESLREHHLDWRSPSTARSLEAVNVPPPPSRFVSSDDSPAKRRKVVTVSMLKGGRRICKPHNDDRGCQNPQCPDAHVCDVRSDSGRPCGSTSHSRANHLW